METRVSLQEARTNLSRLVRSVEKGEVITILRHGKPIARMIPLQTQELAQRPLGLMRDEWELPPADVLLRLFGCQA